MWLRILDQNKKDPKYAIAVSNNQLLSRYERLMHRYLRERELDPPDLVPAAEPEEPEENPPLNLSPADLMMPRYLN